MPAVLPSVSYDVQPRLQIRLQYARRARAKFATIPRASSGLTAAFQLGLKAQWVTRYREIHTMRDSHRHKQQPSESPVTSYGSYKGNKGKQTSAYGRPTLDASSPLPTPLNVLLSATSAIPSMFKEWQDAQKQMHSSCWRRLCQRTPPLTRLPSTEPLARSQNFVLLSLHRRALKARRRQNMVQRPRSTASRAVRGAIGVALSIQVRGFLLQQGCFRVG